MNAIDLRPDWYRAQRLQKRHTVIRVSIFVFLAAELVLGSLGTFTQKAAARQHVATLQDARIAQIETLRTLEGLQVELDGLRKKERLLSDVAGGAPVHAMLAELSGMLPETVVLTALKLSQMRRIGDDQLPVDGGRESTGAVQGAENGRLELTGWASSNAAVGTFMTNVAASLLFQEVRLLYSRPSELKGRVGREFALTCTFPQYG